MNGLVTERANTRVGRRIITVTASLAAVTVLLCLGFAPVLLTSVLDATSGRETFTREVCGEAGLAISDQKIEGLGKEQFANAGIIVGVGRQLGIPPRGWIIAVATAMQESMLRNQPVATDHDSLGLFQQRPSRGWGTPAQLLDPRYAAAKFYQKMVTVPGWRTMRLTDVAQAVQISAFPDRYQKWEPLATVIVNRLTEGAANGVATESGDSVRCAAPGQASAAGWTVPAPGPVVSVFRPPNRPRHQGVDIGSGRGTLVRAAAAGIVTTTLCNVSMGSCDQDGSPVVKGCGWYVELAHGGGVMTRYCHLGRRPTVVVGQRVSTGALLGYVGSSGNSSGPHLHFETRVNGTAVDPEPFMAQRGAPLGGRV